MCNGGDTKSRQAGEESRQTTLRQNLNKLPPTDVSAACNLHEVDGLALFPAGRRPGPPLLRTLSKHGCASSGRQLQSLQVSTLPPASTLELDSLSVNQGWFEVCPDVMIRPSVICGVFPEEEV